MFESSIVALARPAGGSWKLVFADGLGLPPTAAVALGGAPPLTFGKGGGGKDFGGIAPVDDPDEAAAAAAWAAAVAAAWAAVALAPAFGRPFGLGDVGVVLAVAFALAFALALGVTSVVVVVIVLP